MAKNIFLEKEIKILKNNRDKTKGDLCRMFELVTYLTINEDITLKEGERYTYILFKMLEELEP